MSELVQRHMESMTEEIQEMVRTKLYTVEETRLILKTTKEFEYKINGVYKHLQDYKDYIQYLKVLLRHLKSRRDKFKIADRKSSIEFRILKRIKHLYEIALQRFSNDFSLALAYFKFCKQSNYNSAASMAVQNMLKNFSQNPKVWQEAATWHSYDRRDFNSALNVLRKGLSIHQNCQELYYELIQLELINLENNDLSVDDEETPANLAKKDLCCQKIKSYVQLMFKHINDFNFYIDLLKTLEPHGFTSSVQDMIVTRLLTYHSNEEIVWHTLAQRERQGLHHNFVGDSSKKSTKFCLERCFKKYQEGLSKISDAKKSALWTLYLDCLVDLQQETKVATVLKTSTLREAIEQADKEMKLEEKYYVVWAELVREEEAIHVLEKGTTALPHSLELWKLRLKYATIKDSVSEVNQIFKQAVMVLKEQSAPIWLMTIRYHLLTSNNSTIEAIYEDGVKEPREVSDILKPQYIEWIALVKGIQEARKIYNLLATKTPYCKQLHTMMAKLESIEMKPDLDEWGQVHELACKQFGKQDVEVWVNYIQFCIQKYESKFINDKVQQIIRDAEKVLPPLLQVDLKEKLATVVGKQSKSTK